MAAREIRPTCSSEEGISSPGPKQQGRHHGGSDSSTPSSKGDEQEEEGGGGGGGEKEKSRNSPAKKNKRKMSEPRKRAPDVSCVRTPTSPKRFCLSDKVAQLYGGDSDEDDDMSPHKQQHIMTAGDRVRAPRPPSTSEPSPSTDDRTNSSTEAPDARSPRGASPPGLIPSRPAGPSPLGASYLAGPGGVPLSGHFYPATPVITSVGGLPRYALLPPGFFPPPGMLPGAGFLPLPAGVVPPSGLTCTPPPRPTSQPLQNSSKPTTPSPESVALLHPAGVPDHSNNNNNNKNVSNNNSRTNSKLKDTSPASHHASTSVPSPSPSVSSVVDGQAPSASGSGSGSRKQRKNYKNMTRERRIEANARERTRVHTISAAFESLRRAVPSYSYHQRLSKLAILRIACSYILSLSKLADLDYGRVSEDDAGDDSSHSSNGSLTFAECVDLCTQTIQSEGRAKRRQ